MHFRYIILCLLLVSFQNCFGIGNDSLVSITKAEFDNGKPFITRHHFDKNVTKTKGRLSVSSTCNVFKDDSTSANLHQFDYVGDLDEEFRYKIVRRTTYNGETYLVLDTWSKCKSDSLLGNPQVFGDVVVNLNESETTNKKLLIEIWKTTGKDFKKAATINLEEAHHGSEYIEPVILKMSGERKIMFKDTNEKYWQLTNVL